jgi:hypothetical protein
MGFFSDFPKVNQDCCCGCIIFWCGLFFNLVSQRTATARIGDKLLLGTNSCLHSKRVYSQNRPSLQHENVNNEVFIRMNIEKLSLN